MKITIKGEGEGGLSNSSFFQKQLYLLLWIPDDQKHQHVLRNEIYLSRNKDFFRKKDKTSYYYII